MYPTTTLTACLLAVIFIIISAKIIRLRYQHKVSIGAQNHEELERAIRAHGNFAEYTPILLILMLCAEANKANWVVLLY